MIDIQELREALDTGHKASSVLRDVINEMVDNYHCPGAAGFEGVDTFPDCEEDDCLYCASKVLVNE